MQKIRNLFKHEEGFTLIELLVVIAVLGILAAIAIPRLSGVTDKARLSEAQSAIGTIKSGFEMYYAENSNYGLTGDAPNEITNEEDGITGSELDEYIDEVPDGWDYTFADDGADGYTITLIGNTDPNTDLEASFTKGDDEVTTTS